MGEERNKSIDVARGIAIILMVYGHCIRGGYIHNFIYLFHMAIFIFISGYLFKNKIFFDVRDLIVYLKNKIKKLYLFYLKYEVLFFILTNFFFMIGFYNNTFEYGSKIIYPISSISYFIKQLFLIVLGMGREPFCGAFWFIISLIFIIFGYSIIKYVSNRQKIMNSKVCEKTAITICFIIGCFMQKYMNIPRVSPAFTLMLIYDLGNEAYIHRFKIKFNNYIFTIISFISLIFLNNYGYISMNNNDFSNPIYFIVCSTLGIYLVLSVSKLIVSKTKYLSKFLEYLGKITLLIMAWHFIGFKIAMIIQFLILKIDFHYLAMLNGYENKNLWSILYIICGIGLPIVIDQLKKLYKCKSKIFLNY